jgi:hypothetical protein
MIIMPVWIISESEEGYTVLLGSQPQKDAPREFVSKEIILNVVKAPTSNDEGYTLAILSLKEQIK